MAKVNAINLAAILTIRVQTVISTSIYTPSAGMLYVTFEAIGPGCSGSGPVSTTLGNYSTAAGGSAGGYSKITLPAASVLPSQSITIGAVGAAGTGSVATAPGNTTVGTILTVNGGNPGDISLASATQTACNGAIGGNASGGDINVQGGASQGGYGATSITLLYAGDAGTSFYGAAGQPNQNGTGFDAQGYGAGGGATSNSGVQSAGTGGLGAGSAVIITEYCNQ